MWTNGWFSHGGIVGQWECRVVIFYFTGLGVYLWGFLVNRVGHEKVWELTISNSSYSWKGWFQNGFFFPFGWTCKYQAGLFRVKDWTGLPLLEWAKLQEACSLGCGNKAQKRLASYKSEMASWTQVPDTNAPFLEFHIKERAQLLGSTAAWLQQVQGRPYKRAALDKIALSKVGNLSPEQMVCWTWDRLPWDTLFWNKAKVHD